MSTRLYVGNLTTTATDEDLRELFARYGEVESATVVIDKNTNRSRGFALVEMTSGADAAMLATHGRVFQGRSIAVTAAVLRPVRPSALLAPAGRK